MKYLIAIKKANASVEVDDARLPENSRTHIFEYGLRQKLNDSIASLSREGSATTTKATSEEMMADVQGTLDRLYAGDLTAQRGGGVNKVTAAAREAGLSADEVIALIQSAKAKATAKAAKKAG